MSDKQTKYLDSLEEKGMRKTCLVIPIKDIPEVKKIIAGMRKKHLAKRALGLDMFEKEK